MEDAVARYCAASEVNDIDAMMATLAPDAELISPLSARMVFRGGDDVRVLLSGVYGLLKELRWRQAGGEGATRLAIAESRVGALRLDDAMIFELDGEGRIARVRPHLRPWLATTLFALLLGPKIATRPGVLLRALRG